MEGCAYLTFPVIGMLNIFMDPGTGLWIFLEGEAIFIDLLPLYFILFSLWNLAQLYALGPAPDGAPLPAWGYSLVNQPFSSLNPSTGSLLPCLYCWCIFPS